MSDPSVPLTIISNPLIPANGRFWGQIGIGKNIMTREGDRGYWIVAIDRSSLAVVYNQVQTAPNKAPDLGAHNTTDHILIVATMGVGLDKQPQGDFFKFLDLNGGGRELRRVEQVSLQFNCGSLGTFAYALVGILGNGNRPGIEESAITSTGGLGPIMTVQLMPATVNKKIVYTPMRLSDR